MTTTDTTLDEIRAARYAAIVRRVREYMTLGLSEDDAIRTVQKIENATDLADGLDYGPFVHVRHVWAGHHAIENATRTIPPHHHVFVEDGRYTDTGDWREVCTTCGATRSLTTSELTSELEG